MKDLNFDYSIWDYKAKIRKTERYQNELKPHPLTGEKFHYYTFNGEVRVYSLDLVYLFSDNNPIEAYNRTAKETIYLNSIDLYKQFEEGYIYGKQQFENEYKLTTKEMISADKDNLFTILRDKYFNAKTTLVGAEGGWRKILNRSPISIKKGTLEKYGYYSGLLTGLYEMIDQAPTIFEGFLDTPSTDTKDTTTNKIGRPQAEPPKRKDIDREEFKELFKPQFCIQEMEYTTKETKIERLINDLSKNYTKKEFAQIALMIFKGNVLMSKPHSWSQWYEAFCEVLGIEVSSYKDSPKKIENIDAELSRKFYYLNLEEMIFK